MIRRATAIVALEALAACSQVGGVDQRAAIQTEASIYELESRSDGFAATIGFVFTNPTKVRLYVVNCGGSAPPGLEKLVDGVWIGAWSAIMPACLSPPIVIEPGAAYRAQLRFFTGVGDNHPQLETPGIEGTYRLVWNAVLTSYDDRAYPFGPQLNKEQRVSNPFTLTMPQD